MVGAEEAQQPSPTCPKCGAEQKSAEAVSTSDNTAGTDAAEVVAHREWCGAEYPLPPEE
jgi:hypothetical protein